MQMYEWMVKPTPQKEWIERRGILVWIAETATALGAGLYLVSLFYNNLWGMLVAWLIIMVLKIPLHLAFFGKPLRFWRTIPPFSQAWKTSWFSRGITFTILFSGFALLQMGATFFLPGTALELALKILGGITAFLMGIYSGFIMSYCQSVPFWNSALLPLVFLFAGVADGFALIMAIGLADPQVNILAAENGSRILLVVNALIIATYLWNANYTSQTSKYSAMQLLKGNLAFSFWVGIIACGIVIPLVISVFSYFAGEASAPLLILAIAVHTIGAFALKYGLLKAGIHNPLLPVATSQM
ncbi:MAG: polysulfide reductase NrfD [Chloroflexi bacterium]|nr:polysulfide reductase NrfD [Chloroflexota bacterium]